ncbi:MAG: hypothetical protein JSU72_02705 [Deltaproteobacteria bacterium]|nr:MAG: hypothetical protein JSU72_02705 [Deltaproteobacteria bacterium]
MNEATVKRVISKVEEMAKENKEFEDKDLQEFAVTIDYLLKERSRREEVLAIASTMFALDEYKKDLTKLVEYAKAGGLKEREATLLEVLDQFEKELETAVAMKFHQHTYHDKMADDIKQAILRHLEPTLGRGNWHAREQSAILQTISRAMEGYLIVKIGT